MKSDYTIMNNLRSLPEYIQAEQEFQMRKAAAQQGRVGTLPAAIQIANEIQKRRLAGDEEGARLLENSAKIYDKGVQYSPEAGGFVDMSGYGDAVGAIAGTKKAYEANAQNASDLRYDPLIAGGEAQARLQQQSMYEPAIREEIASREARVGLETGPLLEARKKEAADAADFVARYWNIDEKSRQALEAIQGMRDAKGNLTPDIRAVVGMKNYLSGAIPFTETAIPGTPAASGYAKIKQAKGQVFLDAYESLKGGGAITAIEGEKGEQAKARMDNAQSEKDFNDALTDLKEVIERGRKNAQDKFQRSTQLLSGEPQKIQIIHPQTGESFTIDSRDFPAARAEGFMRIK